MEEEAEVLKLQREKAKNLSMEDFGLENIDQDHSDSNGQNKLFQVIIPTCFALLLRSVVSSNIN